mgnify:CR=1 FL=1
MIDTPGWFPDNSPAGRTGVAARLSPNLSTGSMAEPKLKSLRREIILAASRAREGHIASAFSILDLLWVLYDRVLRFDPAEPRSEQRDRFVLSKGHASLGLYAVLAEKGFFKMSDLDSFGGYESGFGGHPDSNKVPGVEASTGSLGHGLPMAVGMAYGLRLKQSDRRVFCIIGDGEANEGAVWEAALLAAHHQLDNFCCLVDYNHSTDRALMVGDLCEKFGAFGWDSESIDGHDHEAINAALIKQHPGKPRAIIANTIKGRGCRPMESNPEWHHKAPSPEELEAILQELT